MPAVSPQPGPAAMPASPHDASGALRPPMMKRHSSQSSHGYTKQAGRDHASPGSQGDAAPLQQPRHHVRGRGHGRMVLPRNHSSGRNLAKMARHPAAGQHGGAAAVVKEDTSRHHGRQRSHEGDTEIRLPGSLDESVGSSRPLMRRNMTASQLPRNTSHTKLKKNYSHGQLQRLNSGRNLANMGSSNRAPPSPGLKGRSKRPKSADLGKIDVEKDLHQQEVELAMEIQAKKEGPKKVGFAVGSSGDTSSDENEVQMDGAGLEEGEWTEESASASPYSTRQNTANNSRRTSMVQVHGPDRVAMANALAVKETQEMEAAREAVETEDVQPEAVAEPVAPAEVKTIKKEESAPDDELDEEDGDEEDDDSEEDDPPSPRSQPQSKRASAASAFDNAQQALAHRPKPVERLQSHAAKEHPNPSAQFLRRFSGHIPAPAMVSNITAMDNVHSNRGSPAPSMHSSRSTVAPDAEQDELVSRFIPSASHPATSSGANTVMNTPKHSHFHTPEEDSTLAAQNRTHSRFQSGPVSPGSTISGSSGAATPALGRSRTELKMLQEKALADMETANERHPVIPAHVYDRRNESLKSYLNLTTLNNGDARSISNLPPSSSLTLGPEIFQGRFKAVHTELRVVQKFRDPLAESIARLRQCKGSKLSLRSSPQKQAAAALRTSKSAVSLPAARAGGGGGHQATASMSKIRAPPRPAAASFSTSASPTKSALSAVKPATVGAKSGAPAKGAQRRGVSFAGAPAAAEPARKEDGGEASTEAIARRLWESVGG